MPDRDEPYSVNTGEAYDRWDRISAKSAALSEARQAGTTQGIKDVLCRHGYAVDSVDVVDHAGEPHARIVVDGRNFALLPFAHAAPSRDDLGRAAYEACLAHWAEKVDSPPPAWDLIGRDAREPWCIVGEAVAAQCGAIAAQPAPAAPPRGAAEGDESAAMRRNDVPQSEAKIAAESLSWLADWLDDEAVVTFSCEDRETPTGPITITAASLRALLAAAEARPRVGKATREVVKFLAWVANGADPLLSVTVKFGGIKEHLGIDRINAAAAEIGEQP